MAHEDTSNTIPELPEDSIQQPKSPNPSPSKGLLRASNTSLDDLIKSAQKACKCEYPDCTEKREALKSGVLALIKQRELQAELERLYDLMTFHSHDLKPFIENRIKVIEAELSEGAS